jgi:hypothetical protein
MKRVNAILSTILLVMIGLVGCKQSRNQHDDFVTVDVTKSSYPKKKLILQDFMDVEYIVLETNDDFICQGDVLDIGKEYILVKNDIRDGDIFIFDRKTGKGLRKINRKGQGSEEYIFIDRVTLDEENGEIFVTVTFQKKIIVYDLFGNFKRILPFNEKTSYDKIYNFDKENLIREDFTLETIQPFAIISKQDGSIVREIHIPFQEKKLTSLLLHIDGPAMNYPENTIYYTGTNYNSIIPYYDNWILTEPSSDTVFRLLPDYSLIPFMVRTPSIQSMNPEVFLFPCILTDRYFFMKTVKKVSEIEEIKTQADLAKLTGYPTTDLMYDRQEKTMSEYSIFNSDYATEKLNIQIDKISTNNEIAFWQKIESYKLVESYNKGEVQGKLKRIAANLDEESNPIIMLVKYKENID